MQVHANAPWTPLRRRQLIVQVDAGQLSVPEAAELAGVSQRCVFKWLARWRAGDDRLADRRSVAHRIPHATPDELVKMIELLRKQRWTTPQLSWHLAMPVSTVGAVCRRLGMGRLGPATPPEPPNRYQRRHPGSLLHLDVKKLGKFHEPGHRVTGQRHQRNRHAGWEYLHIAIDDATRLAYAEVCDHGETGDIVTGFLQRALAWFTARGITVREILTDNGPGYVSNIFASVVPGYGLKRRRTRPYRPRTNGRTVHPDPAQRVGLPDHLRQLDRPTRRPARLPSLLQPPSAPRRPRPREPRTTPTPTEQPCRHLQLAAEPDRVGS